MHRPLLALAAVVAVTTLAAVPARGAASAPSATPPAVVRPHAAFDDTTGPPPRDLKAGAPALPLLHPKIALAAARGAAAATASRPDPEVLGFAQSGEVSSGSWISDLRFNLLTTVAYFAVNVNSNGTLYTGDTGYATWRSSQMTSLINAAHNAGDRVVLTIKAFNDSTIAGATGSPGARQTLINATLNELRTRGGDGVNVDFEGVSSGLAANFTTFIAQLDSTLKSQLPGQSYLTVDTYASAGLGGTMYDLTALTPHVDAFDLMGYGFASGSEATPTAPLHGDWYNVAQSVSDYQTKYGVPAREIILGVPYYGFKWSVAHADPGGAGTQPGSASAVDTYSGALADFSCALNVTRYWSSTFDEPYVTWWSPASGDPCGGNHNSWRELFYDDAQSLGDKYDLVNSEGLRGIGIWALGYDSGSSDLWNEIAAKFTVTHAPAATVSALPASESTTAFTVAWTSVPGTPPAARYELWAEDGSGPWVRYATTTAKSITAFGFPGHSYGFYVEAIGANGYDSGGPAAAQATTTVSSSATRSVTAFTSLYGVSGDGALEPGSSPPLGMSGTFGWNIARGVAEDASGEGGVILDGWGGLHPFGDATNVSSAGYWPGQDVTRGVAENAANQGYFVDDWGGLHRFSSNGAALPAAILASGGYWPGQDVARGVALFGDGSGGVVLDDWGGVHPFTVAGDTQQPEAAHVTGYWRGWDIVRAVVLLPGSTYTHYSGYVLDGWGGVHPFNGAPALSDSAYWPGSDVARGLVLLPGAPHAGYVLDAWGGMHAFGGAPALVTPMYGPADAAHAATVR